MKTHSVLIIDDHTLVLDALAGFLDAHDDLTVTKALSHTAAQSAITDHGAFDIILADLNIPGSDRIKDIEKLVARNNGNPVVILSGAATYLDLCAAEQIGVTGYLRKDLPSRELAATVQHILANPTDVPEHAQISATQAMSRETQEDFSNEDCLILTLLAKGFSNTLLTEALNIKAAAVAYKLKILYRKLGVTSRGEAAQFMLRAVPRA